jgi:hypothetical protein
LSPHHVGGIHRFVGRGYWSAAPRRRSTRCPRVGDRPSQRKVIADHSASGMPTTSTRSMSNRLCARGR